MKWLRTLRRRRDQGSQRELSETEHREAVDGAVMKEIFRQISEAPNRPQILEEMELRIAAGHQLVLGAAPLGVSIVKLQNLRYGLPVDGDEGLTLAAFTNPWIRKRAGVE